MFSRFRKQSQVEKLEELESAHPSSAGEDGGQREEGEVNAVTDGAEEVGEEAASTPCPPNVEPPVVDAAPMASVEAEPFAAPTPADDDTSVSSPEGAEEPAYGDAKPVCAVDDSVDPVDPLIPRVAAVGGAIAPHHEVVDVVDPQNPPGSQVDSHDSSQLPEATPSRRRHAPLRPRPRGRRLSHGNEQRKVVFTAEQRLLVLDCWRSSGLPAKDFAPLVGISRHTLYAWKKRFNQRGAEGLVDQPRRRRSDGRLPESAKRAILLLKQSHPSWGCQRISDMLLRVSALSASPDAVARVLKRAGYELVEERTRPHPQRVRRFERAKPNQLWQTDLFTFVLKRQNRRVHLTAFMDDHSRFITGYGLSATANTSLVIETLESAIASYGAPEELLTDNGPQYVTWRGTSRMTRHCQRRGIRQIVARPRRPQTLGKIERFWGTMWREMLETAIFLDLDDARRRIGLFMDDYNFQRPHRGIDGATPADRFFHAAGDVLAALQARAAANAHDLTREDRASPAPFYLSGQLGGQPFTVHGEGGHYVLVTAHGREPLDLQGPPPSEPLAAAAWQAARQAAQSQDSPGCERPQPICPDGSPWQPDNEPATREPLQPGQSPIDALLPPQQDEKGNVSDQDDETPQGGAEKEDQS